MTTTVAKLAELTGAEIVGDGALVIEGVADLDSATPDQASFLVVSSLGGSARLYLGAVRKTKAGVIFIHPDTPRVDGKNYLLTQNPSLAFQQAVEVFHPPVLSGFDGIHPSAVIHPTAKLADGVSVGPHAVIDQEVEIGQGTTIGPHVTIGAKTVIGEECFLHPNAVVREECTLGDRVILQSGCVIGSDGFGYTTDEKGLHHKLRQVGTVVLEDDVEIGSLTAIDRARFGKTIVRRGAKIDNLVQIAHGVEVGEDNFIAGQSGIAGSTKLGRHVILAGQVGITGHAKIADKVIIGARSGVIGSITEPGKYIGEPARPYAEARKHYGRLSSLGKLIQRVEALEERLDSA